MVDGVSINIVNLIKVDIMKNKKLGFTLAEVLITLAIIGVVAAMTIPTLISNHNKKVVETKLLRVHSVMNQAIKMSTVDNGETVTWKGIGNKSATYDDCLDWFNTYLAKYLKYSKIKQNNTSLLVYLFDGSILKIRNYIYDMSYYINADAIANSILGKNTFLFRFQPYQTSTLKWDIIRTSYTINPGFEPNMYCWNGTYEGAKYDSVSPNSNKYGCYDTGNAAGSLCTKLIQLNGWKIPEDYPYKF